MTGVDRQQELELVARLRRRDPAAFEAVYALYRPRLFSFLARLSRRREVAEDLLEETWLRLVARCADLSEETRLGPWLFTVARNLMASWWRSRALDVAREGSATPSWPAPRESPFEAAARSEGERRLEAGLARLSPGDREALLLVAVHGLEPCDAAAVSGLSPEAFRKRLQRARERLRGLLETAGSPPRPHPGGLR